ncbi:MAG: sugar ABC transporter ATP-binding protein [Christensenella sp.]|nr:sugar ABC transporter ATP-binding protein [Christensenella sp.]
MDLICKGIKKSYGSVKALQNADISIKGGEIRALLGGNGSGKSTIAKILGGSVKRNSGEIYFDDEKIDIISPGQSKKQGIIITSQELSLLNNLTVAENLSLCQLPQKGIFVDQKKALKIAKELLSKWGVEYLLDRRVVALPPNELYLVEFFKALIQSPKVLIVDEITSALYSKDVDLVKRILFELKEQGCVVMFISHRLEEIFSICDSVTIMRNGMTLNTWNIGDVTEDLLLAEMSGKDEKEIAEERKIISKHKPYDPGSRKMVVSLKDFAVKGFENKIDLDVYEGEIVGVAGLQGHGQSALVRQLFGMEGSVEYELCGDTCCIKNVNEAVKKYKIGFISGDREGEGIFSEQSLTDNINVVSKIVEKKKGDNSVDILNQNKVVFASAKEKITELSGGNQQKVVIARWTSVRPKLLLADDPTKGIDVNARSDVHQMMYRMAEEKSAVIMVSSDDYELVTLSERAELSKIIVMYEGRITRVLTGTEITADNIAAASLDAQGRK